MGRKEEVLKQIQHARKQPARQQSRATASVSLLNELHLSGKTGTLTYYMLVKPKETKINDKLSQLTGMVNDAITQSIDNHLNAPEQLAEAMRYSLLAPGKRIRPALVLLACDACNGDVSKALIPAVAIEMVHTFSLIHDDLPAMDDDNYRRGIPTCHKAFDEATAILTGDALLAFAFELIGTKFSGTDKRRAEIMTELASASGPMGMTGGQILDMNFEPQDGNIEMVEKIHLLKTAALIRCATRIGALSGDADDAKYHALSNYGLKLGLAFQIVDDLLDQTSKKSEMGKRTGKDRESGKPNYAVIAGDIDIAQKRAEKLIQDAKSELTIFGERANSLTELAELILHRKS